MLKFKTTQKVVKIGKIKVGGQLGENPTVLVGSIFYHRQKLLLNEKTGDIDKEEAETLIKLQEEFSDKTRNPCMVDLVVSTEEAMIKLLGFVSEITENPILIDSPNHKVMIAGVKYAAEVGLKDRVVYNSLIQDSKQEEFEAIKQSGLESAVLLAYQRGFITSGGRVKAIRELLPKAEKAGIIKPLIDTYVIDVPSLSMACRAMLDIKIDCGLPCGNGAHNAISTWVGFKKRMGHQAVKPTTIVLNSVPVVLGADFILYGPIEDSKYIFPAVSAINSSYKFLYKRGEVLEL